MLIELTLYDGRAATMDAEAITAVYAAAKNKKNACVTCGGAAFEVKGKAAKITKQWRNGRGD